MSNSVGSPSPPSESAQWRSSFRQPAFSNGNVPGRRSYMAKPVYPLIFRNPISEGDDGEEASPDFGSSLRKDELIGGSASNRRLGFEEEQIGAENSPAAVDRRCGICARPMAEKSPWNSHRTLRSGDMPVAAVLSCGHVFHAECLEETTPWARIRDPSCAICEEGFVFSQPLEAALRCARRRRAPGGADDAPPRIARDGGRRVRAHSSLRRRWGDLLKNNPFKKGDGGGVKKMSLTTAQGLWAGKRTAGNSD